MPNYDYYGNYIERWEAESVARALRKEGRRNVGVVGSYHRWRVRYEKEPNDQYDTNQALGDIRRISQWLAWDVEDDTAQKAAADLNRALTWFEHAHA